MFRRFFSPTVTLITITALFGFMSSCSNLASKKDTKSVASAAADQNKISKESRNIEGVIGQDREGTTVTVSSTTGTSDATQENDGTKVGGVVIGDVEAENTALLNHCINSANSESGLLKLLEANCAACHTTGPGSLYFVADNPFATCDRMLGGKKEDGRYNVIDNAGRVFLTLPGESRLVGKVMSEHNCWTEDCEANAALLSEEIRKWADDTAELREKIAAVSGGKSSPPVGLLNLAEAPEESVRVNFVKVEAEDPAVIRVGDWTDGTLNEGGASLYQMDQNACGTGNNGGSYAGNSAAASLTLPLTVEQAGNYFVYLSAASNNGGQDSFYVGINGAPSVDNGGADDSAHQVEQSGDVAEPILKRLSFGNNMNDLVNPIIGLTQGETVSVTVACREPMTRLDYVMLCQSDDPASCVVPENETEYYTPNIDVSEFCGVPAALRFRFFTSASDGSYVFKKPQIIDPSSTPENAVPLSVALQISI